MALLLFDVDGTLIDSFPGIRQSLLAALADVGGPTPDEDFLAGIAGPPMEHTLRRLGLSEQQVAAGLDAYLHHYGKVGVHNATPYPGMLDLLRHLKAQGHLLVTATSKGERFARESLERFEMLELFTIVGAAEENGARRSKAAVISYVLDQLGSTLEVIPQSAAAPGAPQAQVRAPMPLLMIGDREHDIAGAAEFGIDTAAVTWGYGNADEWAQARYTAANPSELEQIIGNLE
ncbi:HAD hydrolase-like protein [Corynebacterium choanae]|uniref:HAD hydrolase-like protein n=1 Tax=Corynebacterium choanae TaxID=1862358 RepID=UPI000F50E083|nr:HAD hydrolase-like protein [Corynebacterium choanae]